MFSGEGRLVTSSALALCSLPFLCGGHPLRVLLLELLRLISFHLVGFFQPITMPLFTNVRSPSFEGIFNFSHLRQPSEANFNGEPQKLQRRKGEPFCSPTRIQFLQSNVSMLYVARWHTMAANVVKPVMWA